ncbi:AFG1/ZapE family ATPase [Erysipelothrix urinaevulpis]|uniref:AFG1/ZapE family ATPase n=1 Tax=Erysipelothrix urinaevulpis TaxID=2683717 RepID=UPI001358BC35|nr:AFG1/ZapE family ATPase [Erysipelothrix urinaevulpis]
MSLKHIKFELSEEQLKRRDEEAVFYAKEPEIKQFLIDTGCPYETYVNHLPKFKRWLKAKREAYGLSKEELEKDVRKGEYLGLEYDENLDMIFEVVMRVELAKDIEEEQLFLKRYQVFPLPESLRKATFQSIDLQKEKQNPAYIKVLVELAKFVEDDELGYFLYGNLGVGKSYLAACVSNQMAKEGKRVAYVHVPSLFNHLKQQFGNNKQQEQTLDTLRKASLLVLDDLGAEPITPWGRDEVLLSILNDRLENKRKTIITSNYKPEMLKDLYRVDTRGVSDEIRASRLVDRILSLTKSYEIAGKNRRHQ